MAFKGYWGDIVSSPYLAFGIETEDKSLLKTQNGLHVKVKHTLLIRACAINRILTSASIFASNNDKNNVIINKNYFYNLVFCKYTLILSCF